MSGAAPGHRVHGAICDAAMPDRAADAHVPHWPPAFARGMLQRHNQDALVAACTRCISSHVQRFMVAPGHGLATERSPRQPQMSTRAARARSVRGLWLIGDGLSAWTVVVSEIQAGLTCNHDLPAVLQNRRQIHRVVVRLLIY